MRYAIIADIHGNLEALQAVLADIDAQGVDAIFCLGDVVGYGPNPCECVRLVQERCGMVLLGNHDQGALFDPDGFNVGLNLGRSAGGSLAEHLHMHVVPRWSGDANFITVVGETKVIPQLLRDTRKLLADEWAAQR